MPLIRAVGGALVLGMLLFAPVAAQAAPIVISGNAQACFGDGCTSFADAASIVLGGATLTYNSNSVLDFSGETLDDVLGINDGAGNFGTLSVTATAKTAVSTAFALLLTFLNPDSPQATFEAAIRGTVTTSLTTGGIHVTFDPSAITVPFVDNATGQSGTMTVYADSISLPSGGSAPLTGFIETEAVPEPATLMLLGMGFTGLVARRRRSRIVA